MISETQGVAAVGRAPAPMLSRVTRRMAPRSPDPRQELMPTNTNPNPVQPGMAPPQAPIGGPNVQVLPSSASSLISTVGAQPGGPVGDPSGIPINSPMLSATGAAAPPPQPGGGAAVTDMNQVGRYITPDNTLRNQRVGMDLPQSNIMSAAMGAFQSKLPELDRQLGLQVDGLGQQTAAMGRTGSGMYDRSLRGITDASATQRAGILGDLVLNATRDDTSNNINLGLARTSQLNQQQAREDQLARDAMGDQSERMRYLATAFSGDPTAAHNAAAGMGMAGASEYGSNAGQINGQLGATAQAAVNPLSALLSRIFGGKSGAPALGGGASAGTAGVAAGGAAPSATVSQAPGDEYLLSLLGMGGH